MTNEHLQPDSMLINSLAEYEKILDNSDDVIYLAEYMDRRYLTFKVLFVSKQAKAVFGYDSYEFIQDSSLWFKIIHREDIPAVQEIVNKALDTGRHFTYQYRIRPKNSEDYIWVEDKIVPLHYPEIKKGIQGAVRDINERKRIEIGLKENEEKYRLLFEKESDAIVLADAGTLDILEANEAFVTTYGYSMAEARRMKVTELAAEAQATNASVRRAVFGDGNRISITRHRKKDGAVFPVEVTSGIFKLKSRWMICTISRDLTERKRFEMDLQESENKFRDLAEKSIAGIYLIQDETFKYVNPMLAQFFGYTVDELIGKKSPVDLVLHEDRALVIENLRKRLVGELTSIHYEFKGVTKNRTVIYLDAYGTRTVYQGRPAVIGTLLDISERKLAEEERERLILDHLDALSRINTLSGLLPICASCKKIRDDKGYWTQIEAYITEHSEASFSHGICPDCSKKLYPNIYDEDEEK